MTFSRTILAAIAPIVLGLLSGVIPEKVQAGPALVMLYLDSELTQSDCLKTGIDILLEEELRLPKTLLRINNSPVVGGETEDFTAVIDCSMAEEIGRIQVIVSHTSEPQKAFELANTILRKLRD